MMIHLVLAGGYAMALGLPTKTEPMQQANAEDWTEGDVPLLFQW